MKHGDLFYDPLKDQLLRYTEGSYLREGGIGVHYTFELIMHPGHTVTRRQSQTHLLVPLTEMEVLAWASR